jgi:hypothetical protein
VLTVVVVLPLPEPQAVETKARTTTAHAVKSHRARLAGPGCSVLRICLLFRIFSPFGTVMARDLDDRSPVPSGCRSFSQTVPRQ